MYYIRFCLILVSIFYLGSILANESHDIYLPQNEGKFHSVYSHKIKSKSLKSERIIHVSLPVSYQETAVGVEYPLIVVLDGELLFNSVSGFVQLQAMNSQMPEAIVVSIPNVVDSRREMTPKPLNRKGEPLWFGGEEEQYLSFVEHELLPLVEKNYRIANFKILIGLSPSASFTLHAFWKQPDLFDGYIAVNQTDFKAVGYDGESLYEKIIQSVKDQKQLKRYLYLSMPKGGVTRNPQILAGYKELADRLAGYANQQINFKWEVVDKKAYAAVLPAIMSGLELIFPSNEWDPSYREFIVKEPAQTLKNVQAYFGKLNQKYGFTVLPKGERFYNRNRLKRIAYVFIAEKRYREAEAIIKYWLSFYPQSANAYDTLADLFKAQGKLELELAYRTKAVELAMNNRDQRLSLFKNALEKSKL